LKEILEVPATTRGLFLSRPNRFLALVELESGRREEVHLHDPGRLPDLALPGREVLLAWAAHPRRKTRWDLLAFRVRDYWCFCHSGYHRRITANLLFKLKPLGEFYEIYPEPRVEDGRLDFRLETPSGRLYLEVKGVTWAREGIALFPDAPTERGLRHLRTLIKLLEGGHKAGLLFLVFRKEARRVLPAKEVQPAFAEALRIALERGLIVKGLVLDYDGKTIRFLRQIPITV